MTKGFIRKIFPLLAMLLLMLWSAANAQSGNNDITGQDAAQIALASPSVTSDLISVQEPSHRYSYTFPKISDYVESNPGEEFPFQLYVTPEDPSIEALAAQINGVKDAYNLAVQWTYVSEQKLNHVADKWLTPHEFLANTPHYPNNPLKGEVVSDCEEQAHTLVSLIRADGIRPEEVRVAIGEVEFGDIVTGHAWIELLTNGRWVALDPSSGPYWDDKAGKLVRRRGVPFNYYASHTYPVLQVWSYYNDIYYLDLMDSSGNAPASWHKAAPVILI
ncbi:transglutaminase-like domain-containing protein [Chloroflexota bacterium]